MNTPEPIKLYGEVSMRDGPVTLEYFGAASFKITTVSGKKILIDPYLSQNPLCHRSLEYFYDADLILVSHGAFDHIGDTIKIMKESEALLICGADVARYSQQMGVPQARVSLTVYGDQKEFQGVRTKAVDARHISRVDTGTELYFGMPMGFVITTENGIRIYHPGDTSLFDGLKLIGMLYRPNIFLVGISNVSEGYVTEMNFSEAALATQWVAPDVVVPMHYPPGSNEPVKFVKLSR